MNVQIRKRSVLAIRIVLLTALFVSSSGCIDFEPDFEPLVLIGPETADLPEVFELEPGILAPEMVGTSGSEYAVSGELIIDGEIYGIGDEIKDPSGITLGATEQAPFGAYGYGVIHDHPEYRLIWVTEEDGSRRSMIVHENDPLFSGDDGFRKHLKDFEDGGLKAATAVGIGLGGAVPVFAAGLGLCIPTVGTTCLIGAIGGLASMVGGLVGELYFTFAEVLPAESNMRSDIDVMEGNRGILTGG